MARGERDQIEHNELAQLGFSFHCCSPNESASRMHMWDRRTEKPDQAQMTEHEIGPRRQDQKLLAAKHCIFRTHTHNYHRLTIHTRTTLLATCSLV